MRRPYNFNIDEISAFVHAVRHRSVSKASAVLGLPQPAVTRRIQGLEEALGIALLDRNTRPPGLTPQGARIYEQCTLLLRESEKLASLATTEASAPDTFRIGMPQLAAEVLAVPVLTALRTAAPALSAQISTGWSPDLADMIRAGELDAALIIAPQLPALGAGVEAQAIGRFELVVITAQEGPALSASPTLRELASRPWILNPDGCGFRRMLQQAFADANEVFSVGSDSFGTALQLELVAAGAGSGFVPRPLVEASAWRQRLRILDVPALSATATLWRVQHTSTALPAGTLEVFRRAIDDAWAPLADTTSFSGSSRTPA
ncbi:MAG: LysR family transcriptional regulator [Rhodocyclaceae bacterium]